MENEFYRDYKERVMPALQRRHGYKNVHQIPKVEKVVINTSVGSQSDVKQALEEAKAELALITGQRPVETLAKISISNFKLRKGQAIGAKVTLRGERMYEFLERFIKAALPRIRDFRGVSARCFDNHGNYTLGVSDQSIFPEVELDKIKRNIGFDVTIVTTARTDEEAKSLLSEMGMPFSDRARKPAAQPAWFYMSTVTDPIADFLARVRNGTLAQKPEVFIPYSKIKAELARILKDEGYITDYSIDTSAAHPRIKIINKLANRSSAIAGLRRVSRPGLRRYVGADEIPRVLGGMGLAILSTSRGVLSGREARKQNVGGELLAYVW